MLELADSYELLAQRAGERDEEDQLRGRLPPALLFPNEIEPPFNGHEGETHASLCSKGGEIAFAFLIDLAESVFVGFRRK